MAYDRDSFLAGLAVGRTLWKPYRDYGTVIPRTNYIISHDELKLIYQGQDSLSNHIADNYQIQLAQGSISVTSSILAQHYYVRSDGYGNRAYQFFKPIPARANRVYCTLSGSPYYYGSYYQFAACINDALGVPGYYVADAFAGNRLRTIYLCSYCMTAEEMNEQAYVTFEELITDPHVCPPQTIVIDVSGISVDSYIGFQNVDTNALVEEIWWE